MNPFKLLHKDTKIPFDDISSCLNYTIDDINNYFPTIGYHNLQITDISEPNTEPFGNKHKLEYYDSNDEFKNLKTLERTIICYYFITVENQEDHITDYFHKNYPDCDKKYNNMLLVYYGSLNLAFSS